MQEILVYIILTFCLIYVLYHFFKVLKLFLSKSRNNRACGCSGCSGCPKSDINHSSN